MVNELLENGHDITIATRGKSSDKYGDKVKRIIIEKNKYCECKGTKAIIAEEGDNAPYNGEPEYSINTEKAQALGFSFSSLKDWIYDLLDYYIQTVK